MTAAAAPDAFPPQVQWSLPRREDIQRWWSEIDAWSLCFALGLVGVGVVLGLSTSPIRAERVGVEPFYYVKRQAVFLIPALIALIGCSTLSVRGARRFGVILFLISLCALVAVPIIGQTMNGATRWISLGVATVQPTEFYKPGFAVAVAWMLSARDDPTAPPVMSIAIGILAISAFLLYLQPDFGQTVLLCVAWSMMFFVAGAAIAWAGSAMVLAVFGGGVVYAAVPYVRARVDAFLYSQDGGFEQLRNARRAIEQGGIFGRGPGEGYYKTRVPDVDADFVYAAAVEEYGLMMAVALIGAYGFISIRALTRMRGSRDDFSSIAAAGLAALVAAQALVHMGVSAQLLPAKGMTLPFVSYGGSSVVSSGLTIGLLIALTRRRPQTGLEAVLRETRR